MHPIINKTNKSNDCSKYPYKYEFIGNFKEYACYKEKCQEEYYSHTIRNGGTIFPIFLWIIKKRKLCVYFCKNTNEERGDTKRNHTNDDIFSKEIHRVYKK